MISYWLGGHDHTSADRDRAAAIEQANPAIRRMLRTNQLFTARAAAWLAGEVSQVIDLASGFPLPENLHRIVQSVRPQASVVYVDDDPEVADSWDLLLADGRAGNVAFVPGDFRDPGAVLGDPKLKDLIDPAAPVGILLPMVPNILSPRRARDLVAGYVRLVAAGSCIAISCPRFDDPRVWEQSRTLAASGPLWNLTRGQFAALFGGLELIPPGIAPAANFRPGWESVPGRPPGRVYLLGGIGRKPAA